MKRARKSSGKVTNGEQNVARLSALPDEVICHILSFLPTKLSMKTSILAKRWRFLWAHVLVLDFEFDYGNPKRASFPGIINTVLLRRKVQRLSTFRLTYTGAYDEDGPNSLGCYEHESCLATVVERNVQILYLDLIVEVPRCLLICKTLVDLTLFHDVSIPPTAPISLPNLKKLWLWNLKCEVDFTRLLSGCPVLEELTIGRTTCREPRGCYILSPTLKSLSIVDLLDLSMLDNPDYMVTIDTPALRYLEVDDQSLKHISISPCTSLVKAEINFSNLCDPDEFCHRRVLKFLDKIRNVKSLRISGHLAETCDGLMHGSITKFGNLTKLEFRAPWFFLSKFLESADHLQVLTIEEDDTHSQHWVEPNEGQCACLLHSLRTVKIDGFRCKEKGFDLVRYILTNAQVLERMEINCPPNGVGLKERFKAIQKIALFRRESKKCELDFS